MLKPRKKITRKELKRDPLMEFVYQARQTWIEYRSVLSRYVGLVLVVVVLAVLVIRWRGGQNEKAAAAVGIAFIEFAQGNYHTVIAQLNGSVEEYSGLKSFGNGLFLLARSELMVGDTTGAERHFRRYIDDYGKDRMITAGALAGLGIIIEGRRGYQEAAELYLRASKLAPTAGIEQRYAVFAGRGFILADQPQDALKVLKPLLEAGGLDFRTKSEIQGLVASAETIAPGS